MKDQTDHRNGCFRLFGLDSFYDWENRIGFGTDYGQGLRSHRIGHSDRAFYGRFCAQAGGRSLDRCLSCRLGCRADSV